MNFPEPNRWPRHAWLAAIAALHLAAFLCWRATPYEPAAEAQRTSEVVYLQAPKPVARPPAVAAAAAPAAARRAAPPPPATSTAAAPAAAVTPPIAQEAVTAPATQPDPFATPAPAQPTTLESSRLAAAGVDRQLRKESLNKFAVYVQEETKLARDIARAQNKEWVLEQTSTTGDGLTMKRYRKGNQEKCEYVNLVGARGQDPFRDGNKTRTMTCP